MENAATSIDQLALGLGSPATAPQAIAQILAAAKPLLTGKWAASLAARAPRMEAADRTQIGHVAIWAELKLLASDAERRAGVTNLTGWLGRTAQSKVASAAGTSAETGVSGTAVIERIQADAAGIRRHLTAVGLEASDGAVVAAYNAQRRAKARKITVADLQPVRSTELCEDLGIRSAIGLMPSAAQLDVASAIELLPIEQRRAVGLCLIEGKTLGEAAVELYGNAGQRSRVDRLVTAAKAALAVTLASYAPMPA